jgi:hypothetical protein
MDAQPRIPESDPLFSRLTAGGDWYHFTVTFDGTRFRGYVNGVEIQVSHAVDLVSSTNCGGATPGSSSQFVVGGRGYVKNVSTGSAYETRFQGDAFAGQFDELQIFNYALNAEEVDDVYWGDGPIMDLRLDEAPTSSSFADRSGNSNNAFCSGTSCPLAGLPGLENQAVRFDGVDDVLQLPTMDALEMVSRDFTLAGWVRPEDVDSVGLFKSADSTLFLGTGGGVNAGKPLATIGGTTIVAPTAIVADEWTHLALRYDFNSSGGYTTTLFVQGEPVGDAVVPTVMPSGVALQSGAGLTGNLDRVQVFRQTLADGEVAQLLKQVPAVNLHLDDARGLVSIENSGTSTASALCLDCTLGIQGRMYGATTNSRIETQDVPAVDTPIYTVGSWVRPTQRVGEWQTLFNRAEEVAAGQSRYGVYIVPNTMRLQASLHLGDCTTQVSFESIGTLTENVWNHVMLTFDGATLKLYINGALDDSVAAGSVCQSNAQLIRFGRAGAFLRPFYGDIDEAVLYPSVLSAQEINDLHTYQLAWYDAEVETRITVDADNPTVALDAPAGYLTNEDRILAIIATDPTSDIRGVDYLVSKDGVPQSASYLPASADGEAWLFNFQPTGSGTYNVSLSARDTVSNTAMSVHTILVDGEGPVIQPFNVEGLAAVPTQFNHDDQTWDVDLSGSILMDRLGEQIARAEVQVQDSLGSSVAGWLIPTLSFNGFVDRWQANYPFNVRPNGHYTVTLNVWDSAGNQSTRSVVAAVDGTPPEATLIVAGGEDGIIETDAPLSGTLVETETVKAGVAGIDVAYYPKTAFGASGVNYVPVGNVVDLRLDEVAQGDVISFTDSTSPTVSATCTSCPTTGMAGRVGAAPTFDGVDDRIVVANSGGDMPDGPLSVGAWVKHDAAVASPPVFLEFDSSSIDFQLSLDEIDMSAGGNANQFTWALSGNSLAEWHFVMVLLDSSTLQVFVDGVRVTSQSVTTAPTAISSFTLGGPGFAGQIDDVVVYDRALTAQEVGTLARTGLPALHLRLDETTIDPAGTVRDSAINEWSVANSGLTLEPEPGAVGAASIAVDGSGHLTLDRTQIDLGGIPFTQMAWVYPQADGYVFNSNNGNPTRYPFWRITGGTGLEVGFGLGPGQGLSSYTANGILATDQWNFVATTFDGTTYRIYVDGVEVDSTAAFAGQSPMPGVGGLLEIGEFTGRLDEVQIIRQAVSAEYIAAEYAKGWQAANITVARADSATWNRMVPELPTGVYEIRLRTLDSNGNYSIDHRELPRWEGVINAMDVTAIELAETEVQTLPVRLSLSLLVVLLGAGTCLLLARRARRSLSRNKDGT